MPYCNTTILIFCLKHGGVCVVYYFLSGRMPSSMKKGGMIDQFQANFYSINNINPKEIKMRNRRSRKYIGEKFLVTLDGMSGSGAQSRAKEAQTPANRHDSRRHHPHFRSNNNTRLSLSLSLININYFIIIL